MRSRIQVSGIQARGNGKACFSFYPFRAGFPTGGATADSARTRSRDLGRLSSKSNSLKEDIEGRKPAETFAGPVVDQIKDSVKLRL